MTYGMLADGPVHGLGADFDLYSSIHQEVRLGVAVSRAVRAERLAERGRCVKAARDAATGITDDGYRQACSDIEDRIRSGE